MFKRSGIVLVSTLFFVTMIVMIAVIVAEQGREALRSGTVFAQSRQAALAAMSGVELAKVELARNGAWGVDGVFTEGVSFDEGASVRIERGQNYVRGFLGEGGDHRSSFVISMVSSPDLCRYRSVNNLRGNSVLRMGDGLRRDVPARSFYVVSKGVCGKFVKYAEAVIVSKGSSACGGGATAAGNIRIRGCSSFSYSQNSPLLTVDNIDASSSGVMTAFGDNSSVTVTAPGTSKPDSLISNKRDVIVNSKRLEVGTYDSGRQGKSPEGITLNRKPEVDLRAFEGFDSYGKVTSSIGSPVDVSPGTYVFVHDSENPINNAWVRIDGSPSIGSDGSSSISGDSLAALVAGAAPAEKSEVMSFGTDDAGNLTRTVRLKGNAKVDGGIRFAVVDKTGDAYSMSSSTVDFCLAPPEDGSASISASGDLDIGGEVTGLGKLFSGGKMAFNSGSSLETRRNSGVAVWCNDDVFVKPAENVSPESYRDVVPQLGSAVGAPESVVAEVLGDLSEGGGESEPVPKPSFSISENGTRVDISHGYDRTGRPVNASFKVERCGDNIKLSYTEGGVEYSLSKHKGWYNDHTDGRNNSCPNITFYALDGSSKNFCFAPIWGDGNNNFNAGVFTETGDFICNYDVNGNSPRLDCNSIKVGGGRLSRDPYYKAYGERFGKDNYRAVFSDDNIAANGEDPSTAAGFREIVRKRIADNTRITGSVFSSKGDVRVQGGGSSFGVQGSVISRSGDISMENMKQVRFTYDPDFVPFFEKSGILPAISFESCF